MQPSEWRTHRRRLHRRARPASRSATRDHPADDRTAVGRGRLRFWHHRRTSAPSRSPTHSTDTRSPTTGFVCRTADGGLTWRHPGRARESTGDLSSLLARRGGRAVGGVRWPDHDGPFGHACALHRRRAHVEGRPGPGGGLRLLGRRRLRRAHLRRRDPTTPPGPVAGHQPRRRELSPTARATLDDRASSGPASQRAASSSAGPGSCAVRSPARRDVRRRRGRTWPGRSARRAAASQTRLRRAPPRAGRAGARRCSVERPHADPETAGGQLLHTSDGVTLARAAASRRVSPRGRLRRRGPRVGHRRRRAGPAHLRRRRLRGATTGRRRVLPVLRLRDLAVGRVGRWARVRRSPGI